MITPQPHPEVPPASNLEDIFVPGLGVRGALDDETPARFLNFAQGLTRAVAFWRRSQAASRDHLRNIARRSAFTWSSSTARIKAKLHANALSRANTATIWRAHTHSLRNLQVRLPQLPRGVTHARPKAWLWLLASASSVAKQLHGYKKAMQNLVFEVPDLARLRRSASALAILFLMVVFVIQEFVMAAKR